MICMVHGSMMELLQKLMTKFIKTELLAKASSLLPITCSNDLVRDLVIDFATKQCLLCTVELTENQVTVFSSDVRAFYNTAVKYMVKKFPLNDPILEYAGFLDDSHCQQYLLDNVVTLIQCLPFEAPVHEMDELHEKFTMYQLLNTDTTMDSCREGGLLRPDFLWHEISKVISPASGGGGFPF
nr:PREDICTED: uncharacterized protein LOC106703440 [Latimeria chalumnae]|eukprot:XP_014343805.1 PREDICTED: uncharacterized protein LOC106703440 [Latimeria chalumnae]